MPCTLPPSVFVQHIEAVREGHQSEGLRRFGGAFPPARCLTIAFKGRRKNLDLAAATAEEAQRWVRGLAKLRARLDAMSQRERLDQYPAQLPGSGELRGPGAWGPEGEPQPLVFRIEGGAAASRLWGAQPRPVEAAGRGEVQPLDTGAPPRGPGRHLVGQAVVPRLLRVFPERPHLDPRLSAPCRLRPGQ